MIPLVHGRLVYPRRILRLAAMVAETMPEGALVLDVGCGDGALGKALVDLRPDLEVCGLEVQPRRGTAFPVVTYDGRTVPFGDSSFDVAMLIDVVHHAVEPVNLLREAARVARDGLLVKDHLLEGWLAGPTLRFMDRVGNARFGVGLPFNFWREAAWRTTFASLGLQPALWRTDLRLYPGPFDRVFGRRLHFLALLRRTT